MQILAHKRSVATVILLLIMAVNFVTEGALLYKVYGASLFKKAAGGAACSGTQSCSENNTHTAAASCCASEKKKSCGCPCCDDSCPMGDACTCTSDGQKSKSSDGLFFRLPGCHPSQPQDDNAYLPLSVKLVYLQTDHPPSITVTLVSIAEPNPHTSLAGTLPAPPVPPPRSLAA